MCSGRGTGSDRAGGSPFRRPGHAWQVGAWLEEQGLVERDDRTVVLLQALIDYAADPL